MKTSLESRLVGFLMGKFDRELRVPEWVLGVFIMKEYMRETNSRSRRLVDDRMKGDFFGSCHIK